MSKVIVFTPSNGFYFNHKRCTTCDIVYDLSYTMCEVCHLALRTRPRSSKTKKKYYGDIRIV